MFSFWVCWHNNKLQTFCSPKKSAGCGAADSQSGLCTGSEASQARNQGGHLPPRNFQNIA